MAASDTQRPLRPALASLHVPQKMGAIPGDPLGFYAPACRNSSTQNESPVSQLHRSRLSLHHTAPPLRDGSPPATAQGFRCPSTCLYPLFPIFLSEVSKGVSDTSMALATPPSPSSAPAPRCSSQSKLCSDTEEFRCSAPHGRALWEHRAALTI